jgi:hypothetical protein
MRVFKLLSLFGIILLLLIFYIESGIFSPLRKVPYSDDRPITWDLFKRFPDFHGGYAAVISNNFEYSIDKDSDKVSVTAFIYPYQSYVISPYERDPLTLKHEFYHFKITELFTRKFILWLNNYKTLPEDKVIDSMNLCLIRDKNISQDIYDKDTRHGNDTLIQDVWFRTIDSLLSITKMASLNNETDVSLSEKYKNVTFCLKPTLRYFFRKILTDDTIRIQLKCNKEEIIESEVIYKNDKLDGYYLDWYDNRSLHQSIQYKNGSRNGLSLIFSMDGDTIGKDLYINNRLIDEK